MAETIVAQDLVTAGHGHTPDPRILVLGPFRIVRAGIEHTARTRQVGRVGAVLAASPGVPVPRERLIQALWGVEPPSTAVNTLQVHISQLRSLAGKDLIETVGDGYLLAIEPAAVDAQWFKAEVLACVDDAPHGPALSIRDRVTVALRAWAGDPYSDIEDPEIVARRNELIELRERALEIHLELSLRLASSPGALSEVIAAAKGQVTRQPLRESGYEILIAALMADGRPAEATDAYRAALEFFRMSVGVEPSSRLRKVIERHSEISLN